MHAGGYSRVPVYLCCSNNNRAATVLDLFQAAVEEWGLPSHIHSDKGGENTDLFQAAVEEWGLRSHISHLPWQQGWYKSHFPPVGKEHHIFPCFLVQNKGKYDVFVLNIIVIAWVAGDLWQRKPTSPLGLHPQDSVGLLP